MKKHQPKTGDARKTRQPFSIDLLPPAVHEAIKFLRAQRGLGWIEIERLSSLPYKKTWPDVGSAGFVDWDALPPRVLTKFPERRLPHSSLHRWYDVRVEQILREVMARAEQARELAQAFAAAGIDDADDAVLNAARDVIFGMLQSQDDRGRMTAAKGLLALGEVMNGARANAIKERKVAVEERRIVQLEKDADVKRKRLEQETESAAKKLTKGELTLADINRLRERTFGLPPIAKR